MAESKVNRDRPIVVAGAGAIGCFVGGLLAEGGRRVALLVRPRVKTEIERYGLRLTDLGGGDRTISPGQLVLSEDAAILHGAGIVLVTVKSADTAAVAEQIAQHAPGDAVVVSLQNGVDNVALLRAKLGSRRLLAAQLADRGWRRLFADQMAEGLAVLAAGGIAPVSPTPIPLRWTPSMLRLPDSVFKVILGRAMKIDPEARSSMWQDLRQGRRTEIDHLQGAVIALADKNGVAVPLMRRIVALIKDAERAGKGPPRLTPQQIRGAA